MATWQDFAEQAESKKLYFATLTGVKGDDLVTNGDFATDTDWTKGTGWTIGGGTASCDGTQTQASDLSQDGFLIVGQTYKVVFTLDSVTAGSIGPANGDTKSSEGTHEVVFVASTTDLLLRADSDFVGNVDNVSVYLGKTLQIANEHYVDDSDIYWDGRMNGIPSFNRRIDIQSGRSQISYGSLQLRNPKDGNEIDTDLMDYTFAGQQISLDLGFDGLDRSESRRVLTGVLDSPSFNEQAATFNVSDWLGRGTRKLLANATYSDTVPNLLRDWLKLAGIVDIDETAWAAWEATNNFNAWLEVNDSSTMSVKTAIDNLLSGLCCWFGMNRDGQFTICDFTLPDDEEVPDLSFTDTDSLSFHGAYNVKWYWKFAIQYWTATGTDSTTGTKETSDPSIKRFNSMALEGAARYTLLTSGTDAETVRDRWWNLLSVPHHTIHIKTKIQPLSLELGSIVHLQRSRYSIDGNYRLIGFKEDFVSNTVELELMR